MLPWIVFNSCEQNLYALASGKREYFECAGLRTIETRKKALDSQNMLYEQIKNNLKGKH